MYHTLVLGHSICTRMRDYGHDTRLCPDFKPSTTTSAVETCGRRFDSDASNGEWRRTVEQYNGPSFQAMGVLAAMQFCPLWVRSVVVLPVRQPFPLRAFW